MIVGRFDTNETTCACTKCHNTFDIDCLNIGYLDPTTHIKIWKCPIKSCAGASCLRDAVLTKFANDLIYEFNLNIFGVSEMKCYPAIAIYIMMESENDFRLAAVDLINKFNLSLAIISDRYIEIMYTGDSEDPITAINDYKSSVKLLFDKLKESGKLADYIR